MFSLRSATLIGLGFSVEGATLCSFGVFYFNDYALALRGFRIERLRSYCPSFLKRWLRSSHLSILSWRLCPDLPGGSNCEIRIVLVLLDLEYL